MFHCIFLYITAHTNFNFGPNNTHPTVDQTGAIKLSVAAKWKQNSQLQWDTQNIHLTLLFSQRWTITYYFFGNHQRVFINWCHNIWIPGLHICCNSWLDNLSIALEIQHIKKITDWSTSPLRWKYNIYKKKLIGQPLCCTGNTT